MLRTVTVLPTDVVPFHTRHSASRPTKLSYARLNGCATNISSVRVGVAAGICSRIISNSGSRFTNSSVSSRFATALLPIAYTTGKSN